MRDEILRLSSKGQAIIACCVGIQSCFPEIIESALGADAAKSQDVSRPPVTPQKMPDCLQRAPMILSKPASMTPEPIKKPRLRKVPCCMRTTLREVTQFLFHGLGSSGK